MPSSSLNLDEILANASSTNTSKGAPKSSELDKLLAPYATKTPEQVEPEPEQGNIATDILKSAVRGAAGIPEALAEPVQIVAGGAGKLLDVAAGEQAEVGPAEAGVAEYGGLMRDATTRKLKKAAAEAIPYSTGTQASQEEFSKQLADIQANKEMGLPERVYETGKTAITHPSAAIPSIGESGTQFLAGGWASKALGLGASAFKQAVGINALLEGGGGSEGAREEIAKTPVEELRKAPRFQELEAQYGTDKALKIAQELAGSAAFTPSAIGGGAATALTGGGAGGRLLESAFGAGARETIQPGLKGIARYAAKEVPKYMAKEIPEETIQGVTGQLGQNIAAQPYTGVPLTEGLVEQGVASGLQGAIGGGVYGGAGVGTDIARTTLERRQREAAGAIDEGNLDTTGTGTALLGADGSAIPTGTTGAGTGGAGGGQAQTDITGATQAGAGTTAAQGAAPTRTEQVTSDLINTLTAAIATNPTTGVTSKAALAGVNSGVAAPIIDAATQDTQEAQAALEAQQDQDAQDAQALSTQRDEDIPAEIFTGSTIDGKKPEKVSFIDDTLNQYDFAISDLLDQKRQAVENGTTPPVANLGRLRTIAKDLGAPYLKASEGDLIHNITLRLSQLRTIQQETTENGLKETATPTTAAQPTTPGAGTTEQAPPSMGEAQGETVIPPTGAEATTGLTAYDQGKDTTQIDKEGQEDQGQEEQKVAPVEQNIVNNVKVNLDRLTPTQRTEWDAANENHNLEIEYANSISDSQERGKRLNAAGQKLSAERRRITGLYTDKENVKNVAFANKIREGAPLQTKDGEQVTAVSAPSYGRVRVRSASGVESWIATSDIKVTPVQLPKAETITLPDGTLEFVGYKTEEKAPEAKQAPVSAAADQQQTPSKAAIEAKEAYPLTGADFQGIHVAIENPAGTVRSGTDANGEKWEIQLEDNYGSMPNVRGADKDHLDVFTPVGLTKEQEDKTKYAYVVDQYVVDDNGKQTNKFDEHKVMLGYPNINAAKDAYLRNYNSGWSGFGAITAMSMADLKAKTNEVWDKPIKPKKVRKAKAAFYTTPSGLEELQGAIKKLGGIRDANGPKSAFSDYKGRRYQAIFNNGTNALTMDDMATSLNQYGYDIDGENGLSELLYDSLRGNEYYTPAGHENLLAIQEKENFNDEQARQLQKYDDAVEEGLIDSTDFDDAIEYVEDDFNYGDIVTGDDLNDFWGFTDGYDEGTDVGGFEGGEEAAGRETEEVKPYTPGAPLLKTYTQEEILEQQKEAKRLAAEKAAADLAAEQKARADRELDTLEDEMLGFGGTATAGLFDEEGIKDLGRAEPVQKTETVFLRDATKAEQEYDDARVALDYGNHTYLFIPNRNEIDIMPINAGPYDAAIAVIRTGQDRAGVLNRNNLKDWPSSIPDQLIEPLLRYAETKNTEGLAIAQNGVLKAARELAEPVKKTEIAPRLSKAQLADRLFSAVMFYLKSHPSSDGASYRALAKAAKTNQKAAEVFSFVKSVNANFIKLDKADWQTADAELTKQLESLPDDLSKEYEYILGAGLTAVDFEQSIKDMQEQLTPAEIKEFVTETKPVIDALTDAKQIEPLATPEQIEDEAAARELAEPVKKTEIVKPKIENPPQWAQDHATDLGGEVVHLSLGKGGEGIALIKGHSVLSGKPLFLAAKEGEGRTRVDIESYTGNMVSTDEKKTLVEAKNKWLEADKALNEINPNGPFKVGEDTAYSENVPENIKGVIEGWKKLMGIKERVYFTTINDAKSASFHGQYAAIPSHALDGDEGGNMRMLANGDFIIAYSPKAKFTQTLEIISHEMGHILERTSYINADETTRKAIKEDYAKWLASTKGKTAREHVESLRARSMGKITKGLEGKTSEGLDRYWSLEKEWFSDQVSRWATTSDKPVSIVEKFFSRLGKALKNFFLSNEQYLPTETMQRWLDSLEGINLSEPQFSRQEAKNVNTFANAQEAENELIDQFGPGIANLINTKVLNLTQGRDSWPESARKAAEGFFTEAVYLNGKVYIDLQSTARYRIKAVVLHELGEHFNLERMLGLKGYADLQNQIRNQSRVEGSETQRVWNQVKKLYPDIDEGSKEFISEVIAKLGENNPNLPWYRRLIAKIKAFLMERGLARGFITGTLTDADMHELLVSSLKSAIHGRTLNKAWVFGGTPAMASSQGVQKGKLLAPNGKPSNLNAVQHAQVRTPEFVKWFGNWLNDPENASKVVDENGEPLVVYHTRQKGNDFTKFRSGTAGLIWFADSKAGSIMAAMGEGDTIAVYLNARSPFNTKETAVHFGDIPYTKYNEKLNRVTSVLERTGDDLIYVEDESGIAFAVQNPNQIKSATANIGAFSEKSDDIRYSRPAPATGTEGSAQYQQQYREWSAIISEGFDKLSSQVASPKLAFLSVQQLVENCKKYLPAAYSYEKYRRLRDGLQTQWVLAGDKVSALTHNILTKAQHGELTGVVQDSTIINVDASKAWTGVKKMPATDIESERYLAFTQAKFNNKYTNEIIEFANQLNEQHTINKVNPLAFFNGNAAFNTLEDAKTFEQFLKAQELSYAAFTEARYKNPNTDRKAKHPALVARYNAMPQASKDFYVQSNELLNKLADAKQDTLEDHVREAILDGNRRIEMNKLLRLHYEANRLSQYYAPLSRYGKFWFYGNFTDGTKTFRNFETQKARDKALEEFKKLNGEDSIIADGKSFSSALKIEGGSDSFILQINTLISGAGLDDDISEKLRDDIYQMYLSTLPEVSLRHSAQHRKGTKGYEEDAERNFANHMTHGASQFSNMKWGKKMEQTIKQLRDIITMSTAPYRQQDGLRKIEAARLLLENWEELSEPGVLEEQINAAENTPEVILLKEVRKIRNKYRSLDALNDAIERGRALYDNVSDEAFQMLSDDWDNLITRGMVDPLEDKIKRAKLTDKAKLLRAAKDLRNSFGKMDVDDATEALDLVIEKTQAIYDGSKLLNTSEKRVKAVDIVDELEMTFNAMVNSATTAMDQAAGSIRQFGFLWNLGASISSTIMNLFQTPGAAMPVALGKHEFNNVLKEFNHAYNEFIASVKSGKYDENGNASISAIMQERLNRMTEFSPEYMELKGEIDALNLFKQDGTVARTQTMDIMGIGKEGYQHGGKLGEFSKKMGWMFHHAERLNREVTLIAAYRLARAEALKKGIKMGENRNEDVGAWADAVEYARYVNDRSQLNYSPDNAARIFRGWPAAIALQFKKYQQGMLYLWGRTLADKLNGWKKMPDGTQEEKDAKAAAKLESQQAGRTFVALLTMQMSFAGALGLPLVGALTVVVNMIGDAISDADEPWDWRREVRVGLTDLTGEFFATAATKGLFNAFSTIGIPLGDVAGRMSLADTIFREPMQNMEGRDEITQYLSSIAGPFGGLVGNVWEGVRLAGEGNYARGAETASPKVIKDIIKSTRFMAEGASSIDGAQLKEMSFMEIFEQMAGFGSAELEQKYAERGYYKEAEKSILSKRQRILHAAANARRKGDTSKQKEVSAWNERHPLKPITNQNISASINATKLGEKKRGVRGYTTDPDLELAFDLQDYDEE